MSADLLPMPDAQLTRTALLITSDMTFDEWADLGDRLERMSEGVMWWVGDWWRSGQRYGERAKHAAESGRWSFGTYMNAGYVAAQFETSRRREVLSWTHHQTVAALPETVADDLLDQAEANHWSDRDLRKQVREYRRGELVANLIRRHDLDPSALGPFPVLYADPPWRYDFALDDEGRGIENQYPTMTVEEIADLPVPAAVDGVLFLWTTSPKLREGLLVVDAWGYEYRTCMVWVKDRIGMGYYARQQHELLLIGARGDIPAPAPATRPPSVVTAPRTEHSSKPDEVYGLIERMYPGYTKCELFQRRPRDGWVGWGNQVEQVSV